MNICRKKTDNIYIHKVLLNFEYKLKKKLYLK